MSWSNKIDLLEVVPLLLRDRPLILEFPVPEIDPILVTSTRSLLWVPRTSAGTVRAALRSVADRKSLYLDILNEVLNTSLSKQWGNVTSDFSEKGLLDIMSHIEGYGITPLHILISPLSPLCDLVSGKDWRPHEAVMATWVPKDMILVVPQERALLGNIAVSQNNEVVLVLHNASRGLGIVYRSS